MAAPTGFTRGDETELAWGLLNTISDDPLRNVPYAEGHLWRYLPQHGLWVKVDESDCSRIIMSFAGLSCAGTPKGQPRVLKVNAHNVKGAIKCAQDLAEKKEFFANAVPGLAFKNGFVEVSGKGVTLKPHSRKNLARIGYNWEYNAKAKSPEFEAFMVSFFRDDADGAEKVAFLQELFGASLVQVGPKYQLCGLLLGDGENGKDTCMNVLKSVFPKETVCAVSPGKWDHEYYRAKLQGMWLNVISELPATVLENSAAFKAITVGGMIDARFPHGRAFDFIPLAGHVFAANATIGTTDFSHGFFRRFCIVRFSRVFSGKDKDVGIEDRLATSHGPAIIAWLLEGAARLRKRGHYAEPPSHFLELDAWRNGADQVAGYLAAQTHPLAPGEKDTSATVLYAHYKAWADTNGHKPVSSTKFGTRLGDLKVGKRHADTGARYAIAIGKPEGSDGLMKGRGSAISKSNIIDIKSKMMT